MESQFKIVALRLWESAGNSFHDVVTQLAGSHLTGCTAGSIHLIWSPRFSKSDISGLDLSNVTISWHYGMYGWDTLRQSHEG